MIDIKRVYSERDPDEGYGVLVDRIWPRGVRKERVDLWLKDVGPSDDLRTWFGHDPDRFTEFAERYRAELADNPAVDELRKVLASHERVTLLYGAKDTEHNQAVVLADHLGGR